MANERETITIENAELIFTNFSGKEGPYNSAGEREFSVVLDPKNADYLASNGWNVKYRPVRDDDEEAIPTAYLPVKVSYKLRPPTIVMITSTGRAKLDESSVETLDWADILSCDMIITPSFWTHGNKSGIKAYLKSLYVNVQEDELERKYATLEAGLDDE
jgi:hypothetical protein